MAKDETTTPAEVTLEVVPVGPTRQSLQPPTLDAAFLLLCRAMIDQLDAMDNLPAIQHTEEIMAWYANGPGNYPVAWQHAILLLEQVLGVPLRGMT